MAGESDASNNTTTASRVRFMVIGSRVSVGMSTAVSHAAGLEASHSSRSLPDTCNLRASSSDPIFQFEICNFQFAIRFQHRQRHPTGEVIENCKLKMANFKLTRCGRGPR
jgi:hypothetical protein